MKVVFSLRHKYALDKKTLKVSLDSSCRVSIKRVLEKHSQWDDSYQCYNEFAVVTEELRTAYGQNELRTYRDNKLVPTNSIEEIIENAYPPHVIDVVEVWLAKNPLKAFECEKELNERLLALRCPWRFFNGEAVQIDSEYLNSEIRAKLVRLMETYEIQGALEEYNDAVAELTAGENKDAIVKAHKSVESVMKTALNEQEGTFGQLLSKLIASGIIPEYYDEFLVHFEKLALGAVKERNLPARGHGQGKGTTEVQHALAEFTINLAGAINLFVIQRWIEAQQSKELFN